MSNPSDKVIGTHGGSIDAEQRHRRSLKNARNRSRRGQATRAPGSAKRVKSRLGSRQPRR